MLRIKEYADSKGVTTQAVYKHINKHQKELKGHIKKDHGIKYLDDDAIEFLNSLIRENSLVVMDNSRNEEIKRLQEENNRLRDKVESLSDKLLEKTEQSQQHIVMIAELRTKIALLESKKEEQKKRWWQRK